jgi:hypothetical protein
MFYKTKILRDMTKNSFLLTSILLLTIGCVDDFTASNPKPQLDAPGIIASGAISDDLLVRAVATNPFQNRYEAYITYGSVAQLTISVLDAPGKVATVSVTPSIPEFGSVKLDDASVAALTGKENGEFKFTFTPSATLPDMVDRSLNLVVTITDAQLDTKSGESSPLSTTLTIATTLAKGSSCFAQGIEAMTYRVTAASGNLDGAIPFTIEDLESDNGGPALVTVTKVRPGRYTFNEATGGIWPVYYSGRANPALDVDLCGTTIIGHEGAVTAGGIRKFTINGTLNNDGTITINWSYVRVTGATPADPAKGTYTLSKL